MDHSRSEASQWKTNCGTLAADGHLRHSLGRSCLRDALCIRTLGSPALCDLRRVVVSVRYEQAEGKIRQFLLRRLANPSTGYILDKLRETNPKLRLLVKNS